MRILIVDDYPSVRELAVEALRPIGCELIETGRGVMAVQLARQEQPDLILPDIRIPLLAETETIALARCPMKGRQRWIRASAESSRSQSRRSPFANRRCDTCRGGGRLTPGTSSPAIRNGERNGSPPAPAASPGERPRMFAPARLLRTLRRGCHCQSLARWRATVCAIPRYSLQRPSKCGQNSSVQTAVRLISKTPVARWGS